MSLATVMISLAQRLPFPLRVSLPVHPSELSPEVRMQQSTRLRVQAAKAHQRADLDDAREMLERAVGLVMELPDPSMEIFCLLDLGRVLSRLGDKVGALAALKRAAGLSCQTDAALSFRTAITTGEVLLEQGNPWLALASFRDALIQPGCPDDLGSRPEAIPMRQALAAVLHEKLKMGRRYVARGDFNEARRYYREGGNLARDPLFQPLDEHQLPCALKHYEALLKLELSMLEARC